MALFTDGTIATVEDLIGYESGVLSTARTEGIDLTKKLELAQEEVALEVTAFLVQVDGARGPAGRAQLENVVVTEPLRKWHVFQALALIYRDAYSSHLSDRYLGKWKEYDRLSRWALRLVFETGVGITWRPIPRADPPELGMMPGPLPGATYFVRVSWLDTRGEESEPSMQAVLSIPDQNLLMVRALNPPPGAAGWNVYAGTTPTEVALQNSAPLGPDAAWVEDGSGLGSGRAPGKGQKAQIMVTPGRTLERG